MTLYTPQHFAGTDRAAAEALIAAHPFATLITAHSSEPQVTHLPMLLQDQALIGHMARANPHWQAFSGGGTVAVFHGPHAYVSPRWYESPAQNVPTWNYATVHVAGAPELLDDEAALKSLQTLTRAFDPAFSPDTAMTRRLLRGIVAFRLPIARLDAKFKMSQNKNSADRDGVIAGLLGSGGADDAAVARWMQAHD